MADLVAVLIDREAAGNLLYGGGHQSDHRALTRGLRDALNIARTDYVVAEEKALVRSLEALIHRRAATPDGYCPNYTEAMESCGCLACRAQTLINEWEDATA
jgi:hypothetical protein